MTADELRQAIADHVNQPDYCPVKPKVIAKQLDIPAEQLPQLRKMIKRMAKRGELAYGANHLVFPLHEADSGKAARRTNQRLTTGTFRRTSSGYGFVRPERQAKAGDRENDIYMSARDAGDAATGDTVRVRLTGKRGRLGRRAGRLVDVLERQTNRFVGTYFEQAGMGLVQVDGTVFSKPIYVGDPGAKGAQIDQKVVVEMVRFPSHIRDGEGVIVEIIGSRGAPQVDTQTVIHEYALPGEFPQQVIADARKQAERFDETIKRGRRDFTDWTVVTIDPADARDFDDAISLQRLDGGHWQLGVHIADVSHFVRKGSPLDHEAQERSTSVYLPDAVIPMLPEVVSNNLASLQPKRVRYTMTALLEFADDGTRVAVDLHKSAIRSNRRFTYEEVDDYLTDPSSWTKKLSKDVHALLGQMHELAMLLRARRMRRGALELSMPEVKIDLDRHGRVTGAHVTENTESHQIIEEFMIAANEAVADTLAERGLSFLRRVHESPDPRKLDALTEFVHELGFHTDDLHSRFALQKLLSEVTGDARTYAVNYAVLRAMQRAVYSPEESGHYALASECYCHFTSPIRRYPDLTVHRLVAAMLRGKAAAQSEDTLVRLADHCSDRENRATQAERELTKMKLLNYLSDKLGMKLDGVITGVESYGLFVQGSQLPAEGFVHVSSLSDDYYRYDRRGHVIAGHRAGNIYRLGDAVRVEVAAVDVDRRELDFRILGHLRGRPARPAREQTKKRPKKRRVQHQHTRRKRNKRPKR